MLCLYLCFLPFYLLSSLVPLSPLPAFFPLLSSKCQTIFPFCFLQLGLTIPLPWFPRPLKTVCEGILLHSLIMSAKMLSCTCKTQRHCKKKKSGGQVLFLFLPNEVRGCHGSSVSTLSPYPIFWPICSSFPTHLWGVEKGRTESSMKRKWDL